eukprot:5965193-Alexandrium_andersonii.AAC.1
MVALSRTSSQQISMSAQPKSTSMRTWAPGLWARTVVGPSMSAMSLVERAGPSLEDRTRRPTG